MNDITGRHIQPLNIVAYPHRRGSSMWINLAMVVEVGHEPEPFIRVLKIPQQKWNEQPGDQFKRARKPRTSVLRVVENVVMVAPDIHCLSLPEPNQAGAVAMCRDFWNSKRMSAI